MAEVVYQRALELLEAELGDEIVGLDVDGGTCFGFNSVAASVWRLLDQPRAVSELRSALLDEYEVDDEQCANELDSLLNELIARRLISKTGDPTAAGATPS